MYFADPLQVQIIVSWVLKLNLKRLGLGFMGWMELMKRLKELMEVLEILENIGF